MKSPQSGLIDYMVSTTLAGGSAKSIMTYQVKLDSPHSKLELICESGQISIDYDYTKFGLVKTTRRYYMVNNVFDESCTNLDGFIYSIQDCEGKKSCTVDFKPFWLKQRCQIYIKDEEYLGFVKLYCQSNNSKTNFEIEISPAGKLEKNLSMREFYSGYITVCVLTLALTVLTLFWLRLNKLNYMKKYRETIRSPSEFTLELKGLPSHLDQKSMYNEVLK